LLRSRHTMSMFELETFFLLGNFQQAINKSGNIRPANESQQIQRDFYLYRSYIEQGDYNTVLTEIKGDSPTPLRAVQVLAAFMQNPANQEKVFATVQQWIETELVKEPPVKLIAGIILFRAKKYEECLRVMHDTEMLEGLSLLVQLFLEINRPDLANRELSKMRAKQDDAIATTLAGTWISVMQGNLAQCKEAAFTYQELIDKYGPSTPLLSGLAVAEMKLGNYQKAEKILQDSLMQDTNSVTTRINLVVVAQHLNQPTDKIKRDLNKLMTTAPDHPWVASLKRAEVDFDSAARKLSST